MAGDVQPSCVERIGKKQDCVFTQAISSFFSHQPDEFTTITASGLGPAIRWDQIGLGTQIEFEKAVLCGDLLERAAGQDLQKARDRGEGKRFGVAPNSEEAGLSQTVTVSSGPVTTTATS